ncbi:MAG: pilus assembly protein [Lachnospiraceae bacterium]
MGIKIYWGVLYAVRTVKNKFKISRSIRIAPRHNLEDTGRNICYKGHSCVFLSKKKGSFTVEASLCVPVFFLVLFSLFYIFQCLYRMNYIKDSLLDCAREYAVFGTKTGIVTTFLDEKVIIKYDEDTTPPICHVSYKMEVPFLGSKFFKLNFYQQAVINNYSGKSMVDNNSNGEDSEEYVYITKSGKVYHCKTECTYLKPSIQKVSGEIVPEKRNSSGSKYKACEKCCKNIDAINIASVYITTYGDRYHKYNDCPKIKRNIRRVKKSETGGLPACSKCGK